MKSINHAALIALLFAASPMLHGGILTGNPATYSGTLWYGSPNPVRTISAAGQIVDTGSSVTLTGSPLPGIDLKLATGINQSLTETGQIAYYFEYTGPAGFVTVDADAVVSLAYAVGDTLGAHSELTIEDLGGNFVAGKSFDANYAAGLQTGSFNGTLKGQLATNTVYEVYMYANIILHALPHTQSAEAIVDPYIYLDAGQANPGSYALLLSSGIGNTPASSTPEPASFGLAAMGMLGIALAAKRR